MFFKNTTDRLRDLLGIKRNGDNNGIAATSRDGLAKLFDNMIESQRRAAQKPRWASEIGFYERNGVKVVDGGGECEIKSKPRVTRSNSAAHGAVRWSIIVLSQE